MGAPIKLGLSLLERPGFEIEIDHGLAGVDLWLVEQEPAGQWEAKGEANALEGTGELEATFSGNEWLPASLNLDVGDIQWPGDRLPIPGWVRSPSAEIHVAGGFPAYEIGCDAVLTVRFDGVLEQEIRTRLRSATSTNGVLLNSVTATTGGLEVMLAEPVAIPLAWPPTGTNAVLNIQSDLSDLSDSAVEGVLRGTLTITPGADLIPGATLRLRGTDMAAAGKSLGGLTLDASLNWPELRLDDFKLGNADSSLTATGRVNLASRELGSLHWQLDGLPFAVTNLANPTRLTASGQFSGSLTDPHQEGTLEAEGLDFSGLYPMNVRADWSGAGFVLTNFLARASANTGELVVGGAMKANLGGTTPALDINLQQLALLRGGQPLLRLSRPSTVAIDLPKTGTTTAASPRIAVPDLNLTGDTRKLQLSGAVAWPGQGEIHAEAAGLQATDLRDFVPNLPDWMRLDRLNLATGWTNGPAAFNLEGQFALAPIPQEPLVLDAKILGTGTNIALQTVRIRRQEEALAELAGELPLTLEPGAPSGLVRLHPEGKLLTRLKADQAGPLWSELTRRLGVTTVNPSLTVTLTGTGRAPRGHVQFVADEMRSENALAGLTAPPVENPKFTATLDDTGKLTAAAEMQIAGQRGTFSGTLPLDLATLTNAFSGFRLPDLTPLEARLRLPNWQISALAMFAPGLLAPQGTLDLDVSVKPGLRFSGLLQLTNLVTKPLEPVGVLRQVHATARLAKHGITLENAGAMLGSQPLIVKGAWEFGTNGTQGYAFSITGTNLPLVRQPDVFLRGDLGLRLSGTNLSNALVSGNVTLKNSLFLRDLQSLVSGNVEVPSARPPFFSIEQPPLADWRLDVKVAGEQFLHVVTPVFRG
ncbi:MAG: hypothetical protein KDM81_08615, partial [Verrucomicrobiae bacterium]|nr:hypothetical protein [Verrucomicrobiae bacterium]